MKPKIAFAGLLCVLFLLSSCSSPEISHLAYQEYPMTVEGRISLGELSCECRISAEGKQSLRVELLSPETLKDCCLEFKNGAITLFYGDMELELPAYEGLSGIALLPAILSAEEEKICDIATVDIGGKDYLRLTCDSKGGEISIYKKINDPMPAFIEAESKGSVLRLDIGNIEYKRK